MSTPRDYYVVLGVARDASKDAIRGAYRRLALAHHPDRNQGDPLAEGKFKEATEAYGVLSDPVKRAAYDAPPTGLQGTPAPTPASGRARSAWPPRPSGPRWAPAPMPVPEVNTWEREYERGRMDGWNSRSEAQLQAEIERLAGFAPSPEEYAPRTRHPLGAYAEGFQAGVRERTVEELCRALGVGGRIPPVASDWWAWSSDPMTERRRRGDGTG